MLTTLLAALVLSPAPQIRLGEPPTEAPEVARARARQEMEKDLQEWARLERASLVIDVGSDLDRAPVAKVARGEFGMRLLAGQLNRRWEQADGRQYFTRLPDIGIAGARRVQFEALTLLLDLMGQYGADLTGPGLATSDLDPATLGRLVGVVPRMPQNGSTDRLLAESPRSATIRLTLRPAITVERPGDPPFTMIEPEITAQQAKPRGPAPEMEWPPLAPTPDGTLDFGDGRMMTVWEATRFVHPTFLERYSADGRLVDSLVFLSGKFTKEAFGEAMRRILETTPFTARDLQADGQGRLMDEMMERYFDLLKATTNLEDGWGDVTPDEVRAGVGQKLSDLKDRMPRLYKEMTRPPRNLSPDSPARLTLALELRIEFGTDTVIGLSDPLPDGRRIRYVTPDLVHLAIGR